MTEQFIIDYIPRKIAQLGFCNYHVRYQDMNIAPGSVVIPAYNELFLIVDDPPNIIVESDYGIYDSYTTPSSLDTNEHEHRGEITIRNPTLTPSRIKFIQVIIVN